MTTSKSDSDSRCLAEALAGLDLHDYGDVLQCMRCGMCLPTCPTYKTDGLETQSPRGRVAMIKAVIDGRLNPSQDFIEHMYHCLDCRNCQTVCPAGVKAAELVLEARYRIENSRPQSPIKRILLNHAVRDQKLMWNSLLPLRLYQLTGIQNLIRNYEILEYISSDLRFMDELLPSIPHKPLTETLPEEIPSMGPSKGRVGFFVGCAMNLLFASVSRATAELLSFAGYTVVIPKDQQCCGAPNIAEGEREIYREMAAHNVGLFAEKNVDAIVTDCAACGSELKSYGRMLGERKLFSRKAEEFASKVRDVSEFLADELGSQVRFRTLPETICFHDPCHLRHGQGLVTPQRRLLRLIPGVNPVEVPDSGQCCGSAGIYNITHRARSMKILRSKVEAVSKTGAGRVITSNPGCLMQLEYARRHFDQPWQVSHISSFLRGLLIEPETASAELR